MYEINVLKGNVVTWRYTANKIPRK